jgi:DNA-binding response OmpR family regulator
VSDDQTANGSSPLVLVADDDEDILSLVAFRLEKAGYRILTASDGQQALELALDHSPDLAVLDVMMPKLTGVEVTEQIRAADGDISSIPIVLLTARVQEADVARGFEAGADDYIKKPFSPQELRASVDAILGRR